MSLRDIERDSIRTFVQRCADEGLLSGRVLDLGCGTSPYEPIVREAGGDYWGYDSPTNPGYVAAPAGSVYHMPWEWFPDDWDAILCTQVIQYVEDYKEWLREIRSGLTGNGGTLIMTGPTAWPIVEQDDLWRFTPTAMRGLLSPYREVSVEERAHVVFEGERWCLGWQAVAKA